MPSEFQAIKMSDRVYWVGAIDWEIRNFHGYSTSRGTTYNAFLVLGDKPILIDTVKEAFYDEMMQRIASVIDPKEIAYIISNHSEMDHSGSLPRAVKALQPERVYASEVGRETLREHFHWDVEVTAVADAQELKLGDATFTFLETKLLHWPDSMFSYFHEEGILFSQDMFSMHLASDRPVAQTHEQSTLYYEAQKYFANIVLPTHRLMLRAIERLRELAWPLNMILTVHGPSWTTPEEAQWIVERWYEWSTRSDYKKVVVVYDTMWQSTAKMAHAIVEGVMAAGGEVQLMPLSGSHRSDIATELLEAGALLVGSPTLNNQLFPTVADVLCYLKGLRPNHLIGQAFGSYGWSHRAVSLVQEELTSFGVKLVGEPALIQYVPTEAALQECHRLGEWVVKELG